MAITHSLLIRSMAPTEVVAHRNKNRALSTPGKSCVTAAGRAAQDSLPDTAGFCASDADTATWGGIIGRRGSADIIQNLCIHYLLNSLTTLSLSSLMLMNFVPNPRTE